MNADFHGPRNDSVTAQSAVVFLHGFLGGPQQFDFLLPAAAAAGYDTHILLLPGHGGDYRAFLGSNRRSWQAYVQNELNTLCAQYTRVLLVGHSMGGLLSILAALEAPRTICGIFAIALPLHLRVSMQGMHTNWKHVTGLGKRDAYTKAAQDSCSVSGITLWNAPLMLPRIIDLMQLSAKTKRQLHRLAIPLTIVHSNRDESVSHSTLHAAKQRLPIQPTIYCLKESGHFYYTAQDRESLCNWFSSVL